MLNFQFLKKSGKLETLIAPVVIVFLGALFRLVPHIPNVAPITAMALFGGVYLNKKYALGIPLLAMIVSDSFLGFSAVTPFIYASFVLIGLIGLWVKTRRHIHTLLAACLFSSFLFFVITNVGVWLIGGLYPKTISGLVECFYMAMPFFRNTILGDLLYNGLFFGSYALILQLQVKNAKVKVKVP